MGLSDGRKSFSIGLAVLIQYRSVTASHPGSQPPSHVAVAITLNAKASSLKTTVPFSAASQPSTSVCLSSTTSCNVTLLAVSPRGLVLLLSSVLFVLLLCSGPSSILLLLGRRSTSLLHTTISNRLCVFRCRSILHTCLCICLTLQFHIIKLWSLYIGGSTQTSFISTFLDAVMTTSRQWPAT